ncbi:hypothetical protein L1887_35629 [Cichorium endivia]|nr:hypothetical protein L1887_35629 [Cichorium endivia]
MKLNLDDDSMDDDTLETTKPNNSNFSEKTQVPLVDVMIEDNTDTALVSTKRKQYGRTSGKQRGGKEAAKNSFSRSDSSVSREEAKERVVPPSSKPATTSLRIDRFLRPFTLKAIQEQKSDDTIKDNRGFHKKWYGVSTPLLLISFLAQHNTHTVEGKTLVKTGSIPSSINKRYPLLETAF